MNLWLTIDCVGHGLIDTKAELLPYLSSLRLADICKDTAKISVLLRLIQAPVEPSSMTSHARQDAREKAGILEGKNHAYGYGTTTTSRHVRFDAKKKEIHEDYNTLIGWDDLRKLDLIPR
jgi:hypothetical protein